MKLSELITNLSILAAKHGELPVWVRTYESYHEIEGVRVEEDGVVDEMRLVPMDDDLENSPCLLLITDPHMDQP